MSITVGKPSGIQKIQTRFAVAGLVAGAFFLVLAVRLFVLQISRGEEFYEKSLNNFIKESRLPADRGMIFDSQGRILVDNRPSYNVTLTPAFCQPSGAPKDYCLGEVLPKLATYLSLTDEEVGRVETQYRKARGLRRFREFTVKIDVDQDALDRLEANQMELTGVDVQVAPHRSYRYGTIAAHTLGYMNEIRAEELAPREAKGEGRYQLGDYVGRRGLEHLFEHELRGHDGTQKQVVDVKGRRLPGADRWLGNDDDRIKPPVSGHNLVLSLDLDLQRAAEAAFSDQVAGAIVAVEVRTGFVLAMVSKPAYDPNELTGRITRQRLREISEDPLKPLLFRPAQAHYPPGSTWKIVTALAALETKTVTPQTQLSCGGGYTLGKRRWRCWRESGHGNMNLRDSLKHSCDTYYYAISDRMGVDPIAAVAKRFGFGVRPGLGLSPEVPGIVPTVAYYDRALKEGYQRGLALNASIGQGDVNVSPLQLAMAYAALANGGTLHKPQLVRRIEKADGALVRELEPIVVGDLAIPEEDLAVVREGIWAVVNEAGGTAYGRRLRDVEVLGKTGTAQVVAIGTTRLKAKDMEFFTRDHAWFAAVAPAQDPEIALVVLSEHGGGGGAVAGPVAMKIMGDYFRIEAERAATQSTIRAEAR
ncbi:MAG: penicillin-binding protein 2 [Myxococcales bacterium]|jgi:penicillin-binding protein 2|nr:penicillin-binding protein 2 [Myxococcales bacterium]